MPKIIRTAAWAWLIITGGLMITPGGIYCIVCGPLLNKVVAVISIALGVTGFVFDRKSSDPMPARGAINK